MPPSLQKSNATHYDGDGRVTAVKQLEGPHRCRPSRDGGGRRLRFDLGARHARSRRHGHDSRWRTPRRRADARPSAAPLLGRARQRTRGPDRLRGRRGHARARPRRDDRRARCRAGEAGTSRVNASECCCRTARRRSRRGSPLGERRDGRAAQPARTRGRGRAQHRGRRGVGRSSPPLRPASGWTASTEPLFDARLVGLRLAGRTPVARVDDPPAPSCSSRRARPGGPRRSRCGTTRCSTLLDGVDRAASAARHVDAGAAGARRCRTSSRCRCRCGPASTTCCSRSGSARRSCSWRGFDPVEFARLVARARDPLVGAPAGGDGDARRRRAVTDARRRCATSAACRRRCRRCRRAASTTASASACSTATARPSSAARSSAGPRPTGGSSARRSSARSAGRTRASSCASRRRRASSRRRARRARRSDRRPSPAATPRSPTGVTADGWLRTGDLAASTTTASCGSTAACSAMINRGGLKVFPDEVEEVLRSHPGVRRRRRRRRARRPTGRGAVGVRRAGDRPTSSTPARSPSGAASAWRRTRCPVGVAVVDALPRNEIGKLLRGPSSSDGPAPPLIADAFCLNDGTDVCRERAVGAEPGAGPSHRDAHGSCVSAGFDDY